MAWLCGYGYGNGWDHENLFLILTKEIKSTVLLEKVDKFTHLKKKKTCTNIKHKIFYVRQYVIRNIVLIL